MNDERRQSPELEVEVTPRTQDIGPGEERSYAVRVRNRSTAAHSIRLSVTGLPDEWLSIDFDSARRWFPGEEARGIVLVAVPHGTNPTSYQFLVTASGEGDLASEVECALEIEGTEPTLIPGVELTPAAVLIHQGDGPRRERVIVTVRNPNPVDRTYSITLQGLDRRWFEPPNTLMVTRASSARADLWLTIPPGTAARSYEFNVAVTDEVGAHADVEGRVEVVEPAPSAARSAPPTRDQVPRAPAGIRPRESADTGPILPTPRLQLGPSTRFLFDQNKTSEQAIITVENVSDIQDQFVIEVQGLPDGWFSLGGDEVSIPAQESAQLALRLSPLPDRTNPPGEYHFSIRVTPRGFPDATTELNGVAQVEGRYAFTPQLEPPSVVGRSGRFQLLIRNDGTEPLEPGTEGADPEHSLRFNLPIFDSIPAGDERSGEVRVKPVRNSLIGSPEIFDFRLLVDAGRGGVKELSGRFVHRPLLSWRVPPLAIYSLGLAAIALFLILWLPDKVESGVGDLGCRIHHGPECVAALVDVPAPTPSPTVDGTATVAPTSTAPPVAVLGCLDLDGESSALSYVQLGSVVYADDRVRLREDGRLGSASDQMVQIRLRDSEIPLEDWDQALALRVADGPFCGSGLVYWKVTSEYEPFQAEIEAAGDRTHPDDSGFAFVAEAVDGDTLLWPTIEEAVEDACGRTDDAPSEQVIPPACQ